MVLEENAGSRKFLRGPSGDTSGRALVLHVLTSGRLQFNSLGQTMVRSSGVPHWFPKPGVIYESISRSNP